MVTAADYDAGLVICHCSARVDCLKFAGAVGAAGLMGAQLYGVSFWDPFALAVAAMSLAGCAFVNAIIPAGRPAAISPMSGRRAGWR